MDPIWHPVVVPPSTTPFRESQYFTRFAQTPLLTTAKLLLFSLLSTSYTNQSTLMMLITIILIALDSFSALLSVTEPSYNRNNSPTILNIPNLLRPKLRILMFDKILFRRMNTCSSTVMPTFVMRIGALFIAYPPYSEGRIRFFCYLSVELDVDD